LNLKHLPGAQGNHLRWLNQKQRTSQGVLAIMVTGSFLDWRKESIDTMAHKAAIENNYSTTTVLPTAFDRVYPEENIPLCK
jgi:hypothetical protein